MLAQIDSFAHFTPTIKPKTLPHSLAHFLAPLILPLLIFGLAPSLAHFSMPAHSVPCSFRPLLISPCPLISP